jgi:hypothetical protein
MHVPFSRPGPSFFSVLFSIPLPLIAFALDLSAPAIGSLAMFLQRSLQRQSKPVKLATIPKHIAQAAG